MRIVRRGVRPDFLLAQSALIFQSIIYRIIRFFCGRFLFSFRFLVSRIMLFRGCCGVLFVILISLNLFEDKKYKYTIAV